MFLIDCCPSVTGVALYLHVIVVVVEVVVVVGVAVSSSSINPSSSIGRDNSSRSGCKSNDGAGNTCSSRSSHILLVAVSVSE